MNQDNNQHSAAATRGNWAARAVLYAALPVATLVYSSEALAQDPQEKVVEMASSKPPAGYAKGFFIHGDDGLYTVRIGGRVQTRFTFERLDEGGHETAFAIQRARLKLSGRAHDQKIKYKFQMDLGKGNVVLKDFIVDYRLGAGQTWLRAGQWKRPFSRQQINSSGKLELVDRAITDKFFSAGRDIGVAIHNGYEKSPAFEWVVGAFNGTGDKPRFSGSVAVDPMTGAGSVGTGKFSNIPDHFGPMLVARVGHNANGIKGYSEADIEGGAIRWAVAGSALVRLDGNDDDSSLTRAQADYIIKSSGFSTTGAVYAATGQDGATLTDQRLSAWGGHLQAGYMLNKSVQPVVRGAFINRDGSNNDSLEAALGLAVYSHGHSFKWQTDVSALVDDSAGASSKNFLARTQLQLAF